VNPLRGTLHLVPVPITEEAMAAGAHAPAPLPGDGAHCAAAGSAFAILPPATIAVARAARYFLAENARSARAFLKAIAHPQPIASLHIVEIGHAPDPAMIDTWLDPLAPTDGAVPMDAVVVSEAGCPGIADPGASVVARAHQRGINVVPWVGPSSILLALMAAGMNGQAFRFLGYLPQERGALQERLLAVQRDAQRGETQIFIETPYRNTRLFEALLQVCDGALRLCLAVDLTGAHAFVSTRSIAHWAALDPAERPALERRAAVFLLCGATALPPGKPPGRRKR
jgi:16S rRNA (cytidine1402-2'-O)-methyltransferase